MIQDIGRISFEDRPEWLKVTMPVQPNWFFLIIFALSLAIWVGMSIWMLVFLIQDVIIARPRAAFVLGTIVVVWLVIWYYVGRIISRRFQYYAAGRELLFINKERLIIRRPFFIWGLTDAFDMAHVRPFYVSEKHNCPTFDYGNQKVYFGAALTEAEKNGLLKTLNTLYFRGYDPDYD
jgi:hypothetical protein